MRLFPNTDEGIQASNLKFYSLRRKSIHFIGHMVVLKIILLNHDLRVGNSRTWSDIIKQQYSFLHHDVDDSYPGYLDIISMKAFPTRKLLYL